MSEVTKVTTNNVPRDIIYWHELTPAERAEFDYIDTDTRRDDFQGFRYRGNIYDLGDFTGMDFTKPANTPEGWDGYQSNSFFSGTVVRFVDNFERVVVGSYYVS